MAKEVPESLLKKRQRDEQWATQKAAAKTEARKKAKENRKVIFKKAEAYVKEYRQQVRFFEYSKAALQTRPSTLLGEQHACLANLNTRVKLCHSHSTASGPCWSSAGCAEGMRCIL